MSLIIIKKLFLAVIGGVIAASGFYWYLDKANPLLQMAQQYKESGSSAIELPDLSLDTWNKVELFDALGQKFDLSESEAPSSGATGVTGREVSADPLLEHWIKGLLDDKAEAAGKAPLSDDSRKRMVNLLLGMRNIAQQSLDAKKAGKSLTNDETVKIAALMAKGEVMFSNMLGMPLSEFMATLTKDDLKTLFNPSPRTG